MLNQPLLNSVYVGFRSYSDNLFHFRACIIRKFLLKCNAECYTDFTKGLAIPVAIVILTPNFSTAQP